MGVDKASMLLDGQPMAARVAGAMSDVGAVKVVLIGSGEATSGAIGLPVIPDLEPGSGPLGALSTALAWAGADLSIADGAVLLMAACDQPSLTAGSFRELIDALVAAPASVGATRFLTADGRHQPFPSAWKVAMAADPVAQLFVAGERSIGAAFTVVSTLDLRGDSSLLADLDTPADVARWMADMNRLPDDGRWRP